MNLKEKARMLKRKIWALFLAMKRKDTPIIAKVACIITVGYALSPIDLVPDFIPILGYLDDIIILPLLITLSIKLIPQHIMGECTIEAEKLDSQSKGKKWYYAIPIILIWVIIIIALLKLLIP